MNDAQHMKTCLELAEKALSSGNAPVGAIVVHDEELIGMGIEGTRPSGDVTLHAEILALRDTLKNGHQSLLRSSVLYTTHEPCIMCSYAIRHYQLPRIVFGLPVQSIGGFSSQFDVLKNPDVANWGSAPEVVTGLLQEECRALSTRFQQLKKNGT